MINGVFPFVNGIYGISPFLLRLHKFTAGVFPFLEVVPMGPADRIFKLADAKFKERKEFAAAVGVSPDTVSDWFRGKSGSYSKRIDKIAAVLGLSLYARHPAAV